MKNLVLVLFILSFFSCNQSEKNPCDVYIGEWKYTGESNSLIGIEHNSTYKITSNGPTYLISFTDSGGSTEQVPATCEKGFLTLLAPNNRLHGFQFLYFKDGEYIQRADGKKFYKK